MPRHDNRQAAAEGAGVRIGRCVLPVVNSDRHCLFGAPACNAPFYSFVEIEHLRNLHALGILPMFIAAQVGQLGEF